MPHPNVRTPLRTTQYNSRGADGMEVTMHGTVLAIAFAGSVVSPTIGDREHVVSPSVAAARLDDASAVRERDLRTLERLLASPQAIATASVLGVDGSGARARLASLDEPELRDLARRAEDVESDPTPGLTGSTDDILVVVLVVLIVLLVLKAV
jgi:hypothetical protein